jgi:membrane associated rhomboid family serine protease
MRNGRTAQDFVYWLKKDRAPVTKSIVLINAITLVLLAVVHLGALGLLMFNSSTAVAMPWTFFTYPLVCDGDILGLVFACYWLWIAGGSLERSWGSMEFGIYFFAMSAVSALGLFIGGLITGVQVPAGLWIPLAGLTVSFAMRNPEETILFMFFLPLKLKYLAMISAAAIFISFGRINILLGLFSVLGCAACYLHARSGSLTDFRSAWDRHDDKVIRIHPKHAVRRDFNPIHWYQARREEKRLKDLFKRSGMDE